MLKVKKHGFVFILILVQTVIAITAGFFAVRFSSRNTLPVGMHVGQLDLGGMTREAARKELSAQYEGIVRDGEILLKLDDGRVFNIKLSEIDAAVDYENTLETVFGNQSRNTFSGVVQSIFGAEDKDIAPIVSINESKLRDQVKRLATLVDYQSKNAILEVKDGKIVKQAEVQGRKLDVQKTVGSIRSKLSGNLDRKMELAASECLHVEEVTPQITLRALEGIDEVLCSYSTEITNPAYVPSLEAVAFAINGRTILIGDCSCGPKLPQFSLSRYLSDAGVVRSENDEGYSQAASTLYGAVLLAGINKEAIIRQPHSTVVDYCEPGLDAMVLGENVDFAFSNTLEDRIAVMAEVKDNRFTVYIVGATGQKSSAQQLRTEVLQRYAPTVINVENKSLKPGETKVISSGQYGVMVNVYRNDELISSDKYNAIKAVVEIAPNTGWMDLSDK